MANENTKTMIVKKDGDAWFFTLPDFENLQISPVVFVDHAAIALDAIYDKLFHQTLPAE
ncbi:MAG: hypothetical protein ACYC5K_02545 [Saccharofermentanales bacterium]